MVARVSVTCDLYQIDDRGEMHLKSLFLIILEDSRGRPARFFITSIVRYMVH